MNEPQISLTGHLGADPKLRTTAAGVPVADFRVAVTQRRKVGEAEWEDGETIWFGVTTWRALAENVASSLHKGDRVTVAGRLAQQSWVKEDGSLGTTLEVDASSVGVDLSRCPVTVQRPVRPSAAEDLWRDRGGVPAQSSGEQADVAA